MKEGCLSTVQCLKRVFLNLNDVVNTGQGAFFRQRFITLEGPFIPAMADFITSSFSCAARICIVTCRFSAGGGAKL